MTRQELKNIAIHLDRVRFLKDVTATIEPSEVDNSVFFVLTFYNAKKVIFRKAYKSEKAVKIACGKLYRKYEKIIFG